MRRRGLGPAPRVAGTGSLGHERRPRPRTRVRAASTCAIHPRSGGVHAAPRRSTNRSRSVEEPPQSMRVAISARPRSNPRPPATMPLPDLVAHRGYALRYPENTLVALDAAIRAGAKYVELDVQLSKDGFPVLMHDKTLARMC